MAQPVIQLNGINKRFVIPHNHATTLIERLRASITRPEPDVIKALEDVSFTVNQGEMVGIIGGNGSGKSTLLKVIAGIYTPDRGNLKLHGTVAPFLELGVGFHPELTARENVFLNGLILGMSRSYLQSNFDDIIAFAELERFVDLPLKNFSSGMRVRLAFAIAFSYQADIYLLDEVLAVGDSHFQAKSRRSFDRLRHNNKTIILVSHDLESIQTLCDRVIWLQDGKIEQVGDPKQVTYAYAKYQAEKSGR